MIEELEQEILNGWHRNAEPWVRAVRERQIPSRVAVTDQAIIDAVMGVWPGRVLDLGCGEGWLVRELMARQIPVVGVDAEPLLVDAARRAGGEFYLLNYKDITRASQLGWFDAVVCNFSLLGKLSTERAVELAFSLVPEGGHLIIQTLHPIMTSGDGLYQDGWREGGWPVIGGHFYRAPWYFRTVTSWLSLLREHSFQLQAVREPLHPATGQPFSLIMIASAME